MSTQQFGSSVPERYTAHLVHVEAVGKMLREVVRAARGRRERVERRPPGGPMVTMVHVRVGKEDRRRIRGEHDLRLELAHLPHQRSAQLLVVGQLAVRPVEVKVPGEPELLGCSFRLLDAEPRERVAVGVGIGGSLVAPSRDEHPHLGAGVRPARECPARRDLGVVGVRVDRKRARRASGLVGLTT